MSVAASSFSNEARVNRLAHINILVADADSKVSTLLRRILSSLGFGAIYYARNGVEAFRIIKDKPIDIVITDWEMDPVNGIDFIRKVRTSKDSPNRRLPIIMLTGKAQKKNVEEARDAGITEFVVKPFTVRTLCDRIILVVEHPRNFILSKYYIGPDRRRRSIPPASGIDRRSSGGGAQIVLEEHEEYKKVKSSEGDVTIVNPDFRLKEKIGEDIALGEIFSPENVRKAQQIIHNSQPEYLQWISDDIRHMEAAYKKLEMNPAHKAADIQELYHIALQVKSQAGMFNYDLASSVAESMVNMIEGIDHIDAPRMRASRKHIDVLYVIFQRNISGMGGLIGKDLMDSLSILTKKYRTNSES